MGLTIFIDKALHFSRALRLPEYGHLPSEDGAFLRLPRGVRRTNQHTAGVDAHHRSRRQIGTIAIQVLPTSSSGS